MATKVRVFPLTKKMKERVKAHGDIWIATTSDDLSPGKMVSLETTVPVYKSGDKQYPYARWCVIGVDCNIERVGDLPRVSSSKILRAGRACLTINGKVVGTIENLKVDHDEDK